jgi:hypothetical protein
MGTSGLGPFDSDDAGDLIDTIQAKLLRLVKRATKGKYRNYRYQEARAATELMVIISAYGYVPEIDTLIQVHEEMRADKNWLSSWDDPAAIKACLIEQLQRLRQIRNRQNRRARRLA